ncbi:GGDEF domain-containing protein [Rhodovarius crocodyli]|nr:diguanylate cyclase [Rhodovarius crocodyli]
MRKPKWFGPGMRHGLAVAAICAAVGLTGALLLLRAERYRLIATDGERLAVYAQTMAQRLDNGLTDWARDVTQLTRFETFGREPPEPASARRLLEDLRDRSPTFSWIGFTGVDGRVIAATDGLLEGVDVSGRPWFRPGLAGSFLGDVHPAVLLARLLPQERGGGENAYFVDAAAPVHSRDGRLLGVIAGHLTWRWAQQVASETAMLAPWQPPPSLHVVAADGMVLLGPDNERGRPWPVPLPGGPRNWRETDIPGQAASVTAVGRAEGAPDRQHLGWAVIAQRDRAEVLQPLWSFGAWLGLGVLVLAMLGGWLAGRNAGRLGSTLRGVLGEGGDENIAARLTKLRDQAQRDPLTGLLNRQGFQSWCETNPRLAEGCAVVVLDLDGFKPINDRHGHAAGDAVLQGIGAWLQGNLRREDAAVRLGGDEFLLCLAGPAPQAAETAHEVGARLHAALRDGLPTPVGPLSLGCSLGVARVPDETPSIEAAIVLADQRLYAVKEHRYRTGALNARRQA